MTPRDPGRRILVIAVAAGLLLSALYGFLALYWRPQQPQLEQIQRDGRLLVATRQGPTTYYPGADGPDGFEYALLERFSRDLGVELELVFPPDLEALLDATERGSVHLAAAGLGITPARTGKLRYSRPYDHVTEKLIYRRGSRRPRTLDEIGPGELHVIAGSAHEATLREQRANGFPMLQWQPRSNIGTGALLSALDEGLIRYLVADSNQLILGRRLYKHAAAAFDLGDPGPLAWATRRTDDTSLIDAVNDFLQRIEQNGWLERLHARYYGHAGRLNFVDTREFWRGVRDRLPTFQAHFERAAWLTGLDWRLLAAVGYQESHWRADAVSPTGVRGIMMLTRSTAQQMGVADRNDPEQSIVAGARYLRVVENKIPERIREPDRLWLSLAGYNVGFGHLEDARILTERDGADPDRWREVKQRLPLLAQERFHQTVRHGYVRGQEPVDYVDNIRNYYDMLVWFTTVGDNVAREQILADADAGQ
jgi:membrane-bound lytic murein transglycosylase F